MVPSRWKVGTFFKYTGVTDADSVVVISAVTDDEYHLRGCNPRGAVVAVNKGIMHTLVDNGAYEVIGTVMEPSRVD